MQSNVDRETNDGITASLRTHILAAALRYTEDLDEAEDVAQIALIRIHERVAGFDGMSTLTTWGFRVAANIALDEMRKRNRQRRLLTVHQFELREWSVWKSGFPLCPVSSRLESAVSDCLEQIPRTQREILQRTILTGETSLDIAELPTIKEVSVRSRLCRARRAVQDKLKLHYPKLLAEVRA